MNSLSSNIISFLIPVYNRVLNMPLMTPENSPLNTINNRNDQLSSDCFLHEINMYDLVFADCSMYNLFRNILTDCAHFIAQMLERKCFVVVIKNSLSSASFFDFGTIFWFDVHSVQAFWQAESAEVDKYSWKRYANN